LPPDRDKCAKAPAAFSASVALKITRKPNSGWRFLRIKHKVFFLAGIINIKHGEKVSV
jgi:hypothetical protein